MTDLNHERELLKIIRGLAPAYGLTVEADATGWVIRLADASGRRMLVFGYDFGLNPSSSAEAARDKGACSDLLREESVPAVEHHIVFRPDWARFTGQASAFQSALQLFESFGRDVVCKDNHGTGGALVFRARTVNQLEMALASVFAAHHACAISPYLAIDDEVRVVLVDGAATAVYAKRRPHVTGDGTRSVMALVAMQLPQAANAPWLAEQSPQELASVPAAGEERVVNWRHNLG
ncbi:MAG: RimK-like protein [Burkholderiales bacterium]|nr:RimK-like protein [Burkholderiales bacterium]